MKRSRKGLRRTRRMGRMTRMVRRCLPSCPWGPSRRRCPKRFVNCAKDHSHRCHILMTSSTKGKQSKWEKEIKRTGKYVNFREWKDKNFPEEEGKEDKEGKKGKKGKKSKGGKKMSLLQIDDDDPRFQK